MSQNALFKTLARREIFFLPFQDFFRGQDLFALFVPENQSRGATSHLY